MFAVRGMNLMGASLVAGTVAGVMAGTATAAPIVDEDFAGLEAISGSFSGPNQVPGTSVAALQDGNFLFRVEDADSDYALRVGSGTVVGTNTLADIPVSSTFSMTGLINTTAANPVTADTGGGMGFGWSARDGAISHYNPSTRADFVALSVVKTNAADYTDGTPDPLYRLAVGNQLSNWNLSHYVQFGTPATALPEFHWYRLESTIEFLGLNAGNALEVEFTAALYDLDSETPDIAVLSGSTVMTLNANGTTAFADMIGQPIFYANAPRGFSTMDDLYVVPEPASLALLGLGATLAFARRHRR